MSKDQRESYFSSLTDAELQFMEHDWDFWGRPNQFPPEWAWTFWLILAGRGFGKTRTGAETVRRWVKKFPLVNLIGATLDDARDIMINGESGILAICPRDERPRYVDRELRWPNGAKSLIFTADEPERMRGKQHMKLWCDEVGSWRYQESWTQAMFGLRLGALPQAVITTTPRPIKVLLELIKDPATALTTGTTYENQDNLAPSFFNSIIRKYEGTRIGRQEINAEVLEDMPGALWKRSDIDATRVKEAPEMSRIVVAIDPAVSTKENSDNTGIVVAGLGIDGHAYVLADHSGKYTPAEWGSVAVSLYRQFKADRIIAEQNNGGDLVESNIRTVDSCASYKSVHASRGKVTRAEPISALYEQKRVHHVGGLPELEDEMCLFTSDYDRTKNGYSPDRLDAMVWALTELMIDDGSAQNYLDALDIMIAEKNAAPKTNHRA